MIVSEADHGLNGRAVEVPLPGNGLRANRERGLRKISRRLAQDLIRLPKLTHFTFQFFDPLTLCAGRTNPRAPLSFSACRTQTLGTRPHFG